MALTSDPHAWLRPIWRELTSDGSFRLRSPEGQFDALCVAAGAAHPQAAARMPEYNPTTVRALLRHLEANLDTQAARGAPVPMWTVRKEGRQLVCDALHLPTGIDLRLMEKDEFRRTHLSRTAQEAQLLAARWRDELVKAGWRIDAVQA